MFVIDDSTPNDQLFKPEWLCGTVPRDLTVDPIEMQAQPSEMKLIPRSEWSDRIKEKTRLGTHISQVRKRHGIKYLDQNGFGYCWAHSVTHAVMLRRACDGQPYVPLSAYSVAATIMNGADRGGWCGLAAKFVKERGIVPQSAWPQGSADYRKYGTAAAWEEAKKFRITSDWVDLQASHYYYQNLTFDMVATCLLNNEPVALDFSWWGHSVCGMDLVEVERDSYGIRILNSWLNWGEDGEAVLTGSKAVPNSAFAVRGVLVA